MAAALGLLIGLVLGGLGGGGSILAVPALVYLLDQSAQQATTTSLVIVGLAAAVAALGHARSRNTRWRYGALLALAGVPASLLGTRLNRLADGDVVLLAFSGLMLLAATGMISRAPQRQAAPTPRPSLPSQTAGTATITAERTAGKTRPARRTWLRVLVAGLGIGALTGFFGVGGGFIIVPVLVVVLGFPMPVAVGTSLLVIALNSAVALGARSSAGLDLDPSVVVPFTATAVAASLVGKKIADRLPATTLTRAFGVMLVLIAVYVAVQAVLGLT